MRSRDLWQAPRDLSRWAVCASILAASAAAFFAAPVVITRVNRLTGVPNFSALLVYSLIVIEAASASVIITYWRDSSDRAGRTARRWILSYTAVIACLTALFAAGETPVERVVDFDTYYATTPYVAEFVVLYLLALVVATARLAWMCRRWAKVAGRPWLRRGLRTIAVGSSGALTFCVAKFAAVAARWSGTDWDVLSSAVAPPCAVLGLVAVAFGFSLPALGHRLTRLHSLASRYSTYRELRPLWDAMRRATPAIVPPARLPWWDFELRLTRRLAEINDGRLALRRYIHPRAAETALRLGRESGLTGTDLEAAVDAARLKTAVAAKQSGRTFPPEADHSPNDPLGGTDGHGELVWLGKVSSAFAASPVVADAIARLREEAEHDPLSRPGRN